MKLWLDDIRKPPAGFVWAKTAGEAIGYVRTGRVELIHFDHDLGEDETGYDVAKEIMRLCESGVIPCPEWQVHTSNPVGRENIEAAMASAFKLSRRVIDEQSLN
jgi:hypothetical protein